MAFIEKNKSTCCFVRMWNFGLSY